MIEFAPCHAEHLRYIVAQDVQTNEQPGLLTALAAETLEASVCLSAFVGGRCVAAAGLLDVWPGRAITWALLSRYAYEYMLAITRRMRLVMDTYPANRIEMVVLRDFEPGNRWAKLLGFTLETPNGMDHYFANGDAAMLYARAGRGRST